MKASIHPTYYPNAKVTCACGNTFTVGSTLPELRVEVCSACHPYYTNKVRFLDAAGRVDAFKAKQSVAKKAVLNKAQRRALKREQRMQKELSRPESLAELRSAAKKASKKKNKAKLQTAES